MNFKVRWQEKTTEGGIQLVGGPTTVDKVGDLIGTTSIQTGPTQISLMYIVLEEGKEFPTMIDMGSAKIIKEG